MELFSIRRILELKEQKEPIFINKKSNEIKNFNKRLKERIYLFTRNYTRDRINLKIILHRKTQDF